jgi:hypothetical protein
MPHLRLFTLNPNSMSDFPSHVTALYRVQRKYDLLQSFFSYAVHPQVNSSLRAAINGWLSSDLRLIQRARRVLILKQSPRWSRNVVLQTFRRQVKLSVHQFRSASSESNISVESANCISLSGSSALKDYIPPSRAGSRSVPENAISCLPAFSDDGNADTTAVTAIHAATEWALNSIFSVEVDKQVSERKLNSSDPERGI